MFDKFLNIFLKGDRKYFTIVFFILIILFISEIVKPILLDNFKNKWEIHLNNEINNIKNSVEADYKKREKSLLETSKELKENLADTLKPGNISYGSLVQLVNKDEYSEYSVEVIAPDGRIIAWNETVAIPQEDIFPLNFALGETYFYNSPLITYLSLTDTLSIQNDLFYFVVSFPFEKKYHISNTFYKRRNFTKHLFYQYFTQFDIDYSTSAEFSKDGREYSFNLLNDANNKIAVVSFVKPALNVSTDSLNQNIKTVQSILIILGIFFLFFGLKNKFKAIKFRSIKLLIITIYCAVFRGIMFWVGFPSNILDEKLSNPAYFSSAFAWGIVKSPIEFFITVIFVLLISIALFNYLSNYLKYKIEKNKSNGKFKILLIIPLALIFLIVLRGFSAAIKSVIFDSTLRYFKDPSLFPSIPTFVMDLNVLLLGLSAVLILCGLILLSFYIISSLNKNFKLNFLILFVFYEVSGLVYLLVQKEPLLTPVLSIVFTLLLFVLSYHVGYVKINSVYNYIYATLIASIIAITLLNFFNLELEKQSLKTTALEINRPNDNLFRFLINETLTQAANDEDVINYFNVQNTNYDSKAFVIWSKSALQRESLNSSVSILDSTGKLIGNFAVNSQTPRNLINISQIGDTNKVKIEEFVNLSDSKEKIFAGIIQIKLDGKPLGYVSAVINFNEQDFNEESFPEFLESKKNFFNTVLNINQLKIFEFLDSRLSAVYGDIYPSRKEIEPIINHDFTTQNDAWINLNLSGEKYYTYVLKTEVDGKTSLTSVSLREKDISWNLFNFFKIFILHSIVIIFLFLILFFINFKKFRYSFRIQLLFAFLFISIIPVIILAVYNRQIVNERSESSVFEELSERTDYIINHVRFQIEKNSERSFIEAFDNAGKELGISFTIYENTNEIFSSREEYYRNELFESKLNPKAYYNLNYLTYREYLTKEKIENYTYNSFYKRVNIEGSDLIIGVNDAFSKVRLTFSSINIDVFLFGVYSFALIIIVIISTFLANRISSPIRRLTNATDSVAHGDLNVELQNKEKGELKELLDGFNFMTKQLKKNQVELAEMERESAWKEMAKQVAHEIKNPLTPMKLAVQQLIASYKDKSKSFDSIFEKVSTTILNQIENLSLIASEFSRFAKMPMIRLETLDLVSIINDTINLFVDEKVKIEFENNLNSAIVEADKTQLRRLFINLIRNSIQANADEIKINIKTDENNFVILINDNGNGISEEDKDKIFETEFTTKEKGMGIGLKLAKRFLEGINGKIILSETSANGTSFKVEIPKSL